MTVTVHYLQGVDYNGAAMRNMILGTFAKTSNLVARDGVLADGGFVASDGASGMDVVIAPGQIVIGPNYLLSSDANITLTLAAGGATARTDLIIARVLDQEAGDANPLGSIEIVKGTTVADPAIPPRSVKLLAVNVPAGANVLSAANFTDRRQFTGASGSILRIPGALSGSVNGVMDKTPVYDEQLKQIGVRDGAAWVKFLKDTDVNAAVAAKVAARVIETSLGNFTITADKQSQWVPAAMVTTNRVVGTGWSTPNGYTQVSVPGWYTMTGQAIFAANANGRRGIMLANAASQAYAQDLRGTSPIGSTILPIYAEDWLEAGDQVRLNVFQDSGGALGLTDLRLTVRLAIVG